MKRRFTAPIAALAVTMAGLATAAPAANASTASEPVVDLGQIQTSEASFSVDVSEFSKASLKTKAGQKIYLNVQAKPMTKRQIKPGSCRKAPVGKRFFNEVVDPATGKHYFKPWRVTAGDNVFCKGRSDGKWRKKSCDNLAMGIFGVRKPPKRLIRIKGVVRDYLVNTGEVAGEGELKGNSSAYVVQYDGDRKVCEASSTVYGRGYGRYAARIKVRSRSLASFTTRAASKAQATLRSSSEVSGSLKGSLALSLEGEAMAMCNYTPPPEEETPPPPPPVDNPPPPPPADTPPTIEGQAPQHLYVGEDALFADFDAFDPDGDPIAFSHEATGPVAITSVERSTVNGKQRLTLGVRPLDIPEGTSKLAYVKVTATAGGKSVSYTATIEVVNEDTGW